MCSFHTVHNLTEQLQYVAGWNTGIEQQTQAPVVSGHDVKWARQLSCGETVVGNGDDVWVLGPRQERYFVLEATSLIRTGLCENLDCNLLPILTHTPIDTPGTAFAKDCVERVFVEGCF